MVKIEREFDNKGEFAICSGLFVDGLDKLFDPKSVGDGDSLFVLTNAHCMFGVKSLALVVGFGAKDQLGPRKDRSLRVKVELKSKISKISRKFSDGKDGKVTIAHGREGTKIILPKVSLCSCIQCVLQRQ